MASITINTEGNGEQRAARVLATALANHAEDMIKAAAILIIESGEYDPGEELRAERVYSQGLEECHSILGSKANPNYEITYTF